MKAPAPPIVTLTLLAHDVRFLVWHVVSSTTNATALRIADELRAQADQQAGPGSSAWS